MILAGGKSSRMGRDKAALPLHGETFLARLVRQYSPAFPVYVSVGQVGKYDTCGAGELVDLHPGVGPLAGLEAAFLETDAEACVIRRNTGNLEPAFGVYRRSCLVPLTACLQEGRRSFRGLLDRVTVRWAGEAELGEFPLERLLQNINTPEAYENAARSLENAP